MYLPDIITASLTLIGVGIFAIFRIERMKKRRDAEDAKRRNKYAYR